MSLMTRDEGIRVTGTIRSIELHAVASKFQGVTPRQVARIDLDIERATDSEGLEVDVANLVGLQFQGPAELVPRFATGERVHLVTSAGGGLQIASIKPAPLS
jgi:hypothetical protein